MDLTKLENHLKDNPCRGILLGTTKKGQGVQISWLMGRSKKGKNRIYSVEVDRLKAGIADSQNEQEESYSFDAMIAYEGVHIVGNWGQTLAVYDDFRKGDNTPEEQRSELFFNSLNRFRCTYDAPVFTPRITGYQENSDPSRIFLSLVKADPEAKRLWEQKGEKSNLDIFNFPSVWEGYSLNAHPGEGYCITTYMPGSSILPSFSIDPIKVPLRGKLEDMMAEIWERLDPRWRVSIGGKEFGEEDYRYANPLNQVD